MVKCNVYKMQISYEMLNRSIDTYRKYNEGKNPNYLVMNYHTFSEIKWDSILNCHREVNSIIKNMREEYHGIPVAIAEHLEDGDIDIV